MAGRIDKRLKELGIALPKAATSLGNYLPYVKTGSFVWSVQAPLVDGKPAFTGRVGAEVTLEQAQACARLVAINILGQLRQACDGDLDRVRRVVRLGGFIAVAPGFTGHSQVMNGASDLMVEVFGEKGRHARFALGLVSLPIEMTVNIEGVFEIGPPARKRAAHKPKRRR
ncbi:MAG: RidA family protein [Alphaproteobacteria bacterium]|nr:RidA family protein [Alphaproteobacteria bacterium]